jgi:hypothetical protein
MGAMFGEAGCIGIAGRTVVIVSRADSAQLEGIDAFFLLILKTILQNIAHETVGLNIDGIGLWDKRTLQATEVHGFEIALLVGGAPDTGR